MGGVLPFFFLSRFKSIKNPKTLTPFKMSKQNIMAQFKPKSFFLRCSDLRSTAVPDHTNKD